MKLTRKTSEVNSRQSDVTEDNHQIPFSVSNVDAMDYRSMQWNRWFAFRRPKLYSVANGCESSNVGSEVFEKKRYSWVGKTAEYVAHGFIA